MKLPQLHLRDLFWLVLVAAVSCAWWVEHVRLTKRLDQLENQQFDWRFAQETFSSTDPNPSGFSSPPFDSKAKP